MKPCINRLALCLTLLPALNPVEAYANDRITTYAYNGDSQMVMVDGPRTDVPDLTHYSYDAAGNLYTITNAAGHVMTYGSYNARGSAGSVVDANGVETVLVYNERGWLRSSTVRHPDGNSSLDSVTGFNYDTKGQLIRVTLPDGSSLSREYDAAGRLVASQNSVGERMEYSYDAAGNNVAETTRDAGGVITRQLNRSFDELDRVLAILGGAGHSRRFTYDVNGNLETEIDGNNNTTSNQYDALGRLVRILAPLAHTTSYHTDARGNLLRHTDPRGLQTSYSYDGLDNLVSESSPDAGVWLYSYDQAGNRISSTDANGQISTQTHDALGRITRREHVDNTLTMRRSYDQSRFGLGRLTGITDASGSRTFAYDHRGNIAAEDVSIGEAVLQSIQYSYNKADRLIQVRYPSGRVVDYVRGPEGYPVRVTMTYNGQQQTIVEGIKFLPWGPLSGLIYGNGIKHERVYDLDYRPTRLDSGFIATSDLTYDGADNIISRSRQGEGVAETYGYDALNRLNSAEGEYGALAYGYDRSGNRTSYSTADSVETYSYSVDNNRLQGSDRWRYQYDANGSLVGKAAIDGSGDGDFYSYGAGGRLREVVRRQTVVSGKGKHQTITQVDTQLARYTYDASGRRVIRQGTESEVHYVYAHSGELLVETDGSGTILREYVYLEGEPLALVEHTSDQAPPMQGLEYILDDGDSGTAGSGWLSTKKRQAYNQYYSLSTEAGNTYRWTPLITDPGRYDVYAWWPGSKKHNELALYQIFHNGELSQSFADQSGTGKQWVLLGNYEFDATGGEFIELSDAGGATAADAIRFVQRLPATPPSITTTVYFYHTDHLGAPRQITDSAGSVVWSARARPFGDTQIEIASIDSHLRFPGQYFDEGTLLHQNHFRDYDPLLGRYIQSDPIGLEGGSNTYAYGDNNPLIYTDKTGLDAFSAFAQSGFTSGTAGASVNVGIGMDTEGRMCMTTTLCGRMGAGISGNLGFGVEHSTSNFCEGDSASGGVFGNVGIGMVQSASFTTGGDNMSSAVGIGLGGGFSAGSQACLTKVVCL